jgi:hypothetical protein
MVKKRKKEEKSMVAESSYYYVYSEDKWFWLFVLTFLLLSGFVIYLAYLLAKGGRSIICPCFEVDLESSSSSVVQQDFV